MGKERGNRTGLGGRLMGMRRYLVLAVVLAACAAPAVEPGTSEAPVSSEPSVTETSVTEPETSTTVEETTTTTPTTTTMPSSEDTVIPKPPPERVPPPSPPPVEVGDGEVPAAYLAAVVADAAERAGVSADEVSVLEATAVVWSDGSLGCPEPGQSYIQMLIDGYRVVVSAGGRTLDYRLDGEGSFFVCEGLGGIPDAPPDA